ncbi:ABC1 family-domain-containing protein [Scenedesmus sp. NREL 46B-D3]|nr:ABC1 family-domain-containing protein [Scenedesmus sp. NREL 46B-D3]
MAVGKGWRPPTICIALTTPSSPWRQVLTALTKLALLQQQHHPTATSRSYADSVRQLVAELGVLWVKLGQTLSVRPDLVGTRLAAALAGLQEGSPPFNDATAAAIIAADLYKPSCELFSWLSPTPVASASLGQVYQARLASNGTLVAVKVQRPAVWQQVQVDLAVLLLLLRLLRWAGRIKQDITLWADTLGGGLAQELDYQQEARNLELFAAAHSHLGFVITPAVQQQQQLLQLVKMGVEASLCQLVTTGVLHADPHPGNLLLTPQGQLAYIDFGLLVQVPPDASLAMMGALLHWALADWLALAHDLGGMGLLKPSTDRAELAADLEQQFTRLYTAVPAPQSGYESGSSAQSAAVAAAGGQAAPAGLAGGQQQQQQQQQQHSLLLSKAGAISFGDFAGVIAALALKYRFELPPYYTLVIRSLTTLEGFALLADPGARSGVARAAVRAVARQLLTDTRPAAQQLLCEVLRSPTTPDRINLPLLQEWLSLQQQPQQQRSQQQQQWQQHCQTLVQQPQQQPWLGIASTV